jgi:hypothetical protein
MSITVTVVLVVLGVALICAGLLLAWRRSAVQPAARVPVSKAEPPGVTQGEFQAAPASEAIEELVNQRLASFPELAGTRVDFGTAADGSLEIWVGDQQYSSIDDIRDRRIRQAVQEAVASFNQ